jgi:hypothetical protein
MSSETVKLQNLETGETIEVTQDSAESLLQQDKFIPDEGTQTSSGKQGEVENLETDDKAGQKQQKTQSNNGSDDEFTATAKPGGLPEGQHQGTIIDMETKEVNVGKGQTATYLDLIIDVPEQNGQTRVGYPFNITNNSNLGKVLKKWVGEIEVGRDYNAKEILLEEPVIFLVQEDDDGYSNVIPDSVKPVN